MQDKFRTKEQLLNELAKLRPRVTELEKSQIHLKRAEEDIRRLASFPLLNPNPVLEVDSSGEITFFNKATEKTLEDMGMDENDIKAFLPEGLTASLRNWDKEDKPPLSCEIIINDRVFNESIYFVPRHNTAHIYVTEITERKQIEKALRESEEKYRSLLEHAYDAIMIADFDGKLLEVNKKAEELLGYTKEELLGASISQLHPEEEHGKILRTFKQMLEGKTHSLLDTKVLRKDGKTIPVDISGGVIGYGGRQVAQGIFRDIIERKTMEEHLQEYQEHLEGIVEERTKELRMKSLNLEEVNTALRVLLEQREQDKNELEDKILFNVKKLILPHLDSLKQRHLDDEQRTYLDVLETNLRNIISPFAKKLTSIQENFTPQEIKVADFIRDGKTVKEIAVAFGVSVTTINAHRQHIRNKLGLNNHKVNLRTYLLSLVQ